MLISRQPRPSLQLFVRRLWAIEPKQGRLVQPSREHVLPTGQMHLAIRLSGPALRVFSDESDQQGLVLSHAVVGGARAEFYIREAGALGRSVGVQFQPGAAPFLFGTPADALTRRHTPLADLWGSQAGDWMDQLDAAPDAESRLDLLEDLVARQLPAEAPLQAAVACALQALGNGAAVAEAVRASGLSHRHLLTLFRQSTGLAPKEYSRVLRLQSVLRQFARGRAGAWADVAIEAGYSDQSHFNREFRAFSGLTPQAWLRAAPAHPHHVPVVQQARGSRFKFLQDHRVAPA